jgi:hypothetical protein
VSSYTGESAWIPLGAGVEVAVTLTAVSLETLDGAKVTLADESALETVPP